jgi:hypothetical protein
MVPKHIELPMMRTRSELRRKILASFLFFIMNELKDKIKFVATWIGIKAADPII